MTGKQIYKKLAWLNELPAAEAELLFSECSGSREWARSMTESRPYRMLGQLFLRADEAWSQIVSGDPHGSAPGWELIEERLIKMLER